MTGDSDWLLMIEKPGGRIEEDLRFLLGANILVKTAGDVHYDIGCERKPCFFKVSHVILNWHAHYSGLHVFVSWKYVCGNCN
jgi:hypothetical protein